MPDPGRGPRCRQRHPENQPPSPRPRRGSPQRFGDDLVDLVGLDQEPVVAGGRGDLDVKLTEGTRFGPFEALSTPGHAPDHFALIYGRACFTGDAVLGEGSVFIAPDPGALAGYLAGLEKMRERDLDVLCPGHGPAIWEARAKLGEYIEHRLERERKLLEGLASGRRSVSELLDSVLTIYRGRLNALNIQVERDFNADMDLFCFSGELRQVFANLVGNAIDASAGGGRLLVRARRSHNWKEPEQTPGVRFVVADTGLGMERAVRDMKEAMTMTRARAKR